MEYTPITIDNIEFLQWSRVHKEFNKYQPVVNVPSCFVKRKFDKYYFPAPVRPENHSPLCDCLDCVNFHLLTSDPTLIDKTVSGNDGRFKLIIKRFIQ